jgi:hypothetical protein
MSHDQYGRPQQQGYGYTSYTSPADGATMSGPSVRAMMPTVGQMGGQGPVPWVRYPFFPTAPFYSTNPAVGHQIRYYSGGLLGTDQDVVLGSETIRVVQFDIPCRVVAINASCAPTTAAAAAAVPFTTNIDPRDMFLFRVEYTTGDKLHISARLGSTVTGTAQRPGELGGVGYTIDQGGGLILGITPSPMLSGLQGAYKIDITLHALEIRGSSNFVGGR